ncbi:efflux RND transporter permease subunit [Amylibacter sp. IMCC11727]|uniref:efflux RND transporter permease subunit n=1 Tax=Amylibacter sp. IMCC11727 TaxID=3039851 RepID=UPI00244E0411|nr:efflux RND transporter permease subunit [Amylibacter sp. IMCC11727]WGI23476.1 efflux RND transporter permease subunit [Amylibacter sp. IMCC11727]
MTGLVDWASARARMIFAFIALSLIAGGYSYATLPKEGEPDIDVPALFVSVPFPGISAEDSEKLLVKPLESKLSELDGLKTISGIASENYALVVMEFEFGWDKTATIANVRDKVNQAEADFPEGGEQYTIDEFNFSQFPILVVSLSGQIPERTLLRVAKDLQDDIEGHSGVLEAGLAGHRDEMLEVLIDPLKLEAYNVTAGELINVVTNNNQLIAAGEVETANGAFSVKIPSAFDEPQDVYNLPVKVNGDSVITLRDLADIRLTFEDRLGTARYNGQTTVALQVVKRKGFNLINTVTDVRQLVNDAKADWPEELQDSIQVSFSMDESNQVADMVSQLEASVFTAVALVMIVILAALGVRSALLVGFAIPTSFLLAFALMALSGISISNMVMFGLILAVGMLVDGAIVVVEYADKEISKGVGPMRAYAAAAKRMFWPIISSTATTLCAFLPMLFWPGVPGEFMRMLPITLIFVLSASLLVALVYLPVVGGVAGRVSALLENIASAMRAKLHWTIRLALFAASAALLFSSVLMLLRGEVLGSAPSFLIACLALAITGGSITPLRKEKKVQAGYKRSPFGWFIHAITGNPIMPVVSIIAVLGFVMMVFSVFGENSKGTEFFVTTEPERANAYVRARGNLSLDEKDQLLRQVEASIKDVKYIESTFAFAGEGGLSQNTGGAAPPIDTIGQVQIELVNWSERPIGSGQGILDEINERIKNIPGIQAEVTEQAMGPASGKPLNLRLKGEDWDQLLAAAEIVRAKFEATKGLTQIEDTRPLPGIDWQIDVDVERAGRYGADVLSVGAMVQLVTRGLLLDTMRVDSSDEEIEIRVRLPEQDRILSTIDTLRVRTASGLIPLSNFITRTPVQKLGQIDRADSQRYFDVKSDVDATLFVNADGEFVDADEAGAKPFSGSIAIAAMTKWLEEEADLPNGVNWKWEGDQEDEEESAAFLGKAFMGALGLMFVILLAQFNSIYNSVLVLLAVVLSTTGVLIGMLVMDQTFSIIMTGTGIVALAGIVVNNNIVLIDTYQEYAKYMPRLQAIVRTAEDRIRPVLLTTITTMAGLAPMMIGLSIDFANGGYSIDAPTALWWKQLATAVVFGLGIATVLTLVFTPSMLAFRVWVAEGAYLGGTTVGSLIAGAQSKVAKNRVQRKATKKAQAAELTWEDIADNGPEPLVEAPDPAPVTPLKAAE